MYPPSPPPDPGHVRIGDAERAAVADRLSAHAAAGRLSVEELEQRLERAGAAVFAADLRALEADLPGPVRRAASRPRPPLPLVALACLALAVLATILTGHPIVAPLIAAALLWRAGLRRGPGHSSIALPRSLP